MEETQPAITGKKLKATAPSQVMKISTHGPMLRHCTPYWHANRVSAKGRWLNREILEMVSTEFRDRSVEYYVRPLEAFRQIPILTSLYL